MKDGAPVLSKTKIGAAAAAGLSLAQTQAQIVQEGEEAGLSSGELERLQAEAAEMWKDFDTTAFRPKITAAIGGLMRKNLREGSEGNELPPDPTKPIGVPPGFKPKPIGPVLPNKEVASDEISIEKIEMLIKRGADNDLIKEFTGASDGVINQIRDVMKRKKQAGGGVMSIPVRTNSEGIRELDMRKTGGFVPIGVKEKADDVPAMLSKNEFVMTADAVRAAGGGSVQKGAQKMYDTMKKLESRVA